MTGLLSVRRFGLALGATSALLYIGCVFVMMTASREDVVAFFNSMMHGIDIEPIMRWDMPWWEAVIGAVEVFILGWLVGAVLAAFYNIGLKPKDKRHQS